MTRSPHSFPTHLPNTPAISVTAQIAPLASCADHCRMDESDILAREIAQNITIRKWSTLASLSILLYEYVITLNEEIRYIWRLPISVVRVVYVLARYVGIVTQIINVFLVFWTLSATSIAERTCKKWFTFQTVAGCVLIAALDCILMLRVYALHQRNKHVGLFLLLLFFGQIGLDVVLGPMSVDVRYNGVCDSTETHSSVMYFCASVWVTHLSLGVLTAAKYDLMKMNIPIVRIVTRDGAWIMFIVCAFFAGITPLAIKNQVSKAHVVLGWPISILSVGCCRMIMNMQTLDISTESRTDVENAPDLLTELHTLQLELHEL